MSLVNVGAVAGSLAMANSGKTAIAPNTSALGRIHRQTLVDLTIMRSLFDETKQLNWMRLVMSKCRARDEGKEVRRFCQSCSGRISRGEFSAGPRRKLPRRQDSHPPSGRNWIAGFPFVLRRVTGIRHIPDFTAKDPVTRPCLPTPACRT